MEITGLALILVARAERSGMIASRPFGNYRRKKTATGFLEPTEFTGCCAAARSAATGAKHVAERVVNKVNLPAEDRPISHQLIVRIEEIERTGDSGIESEGRWGSQGVAGATISPEQICSTFLFPKACLSLPLIRFRHETLQLCY